MAPLPLVLRRAVPYPMTTAQEAARRGKGSPPRGSAGSRYAFEEIGEKESDLRKGDEQGDDDRLPEHERQHAQP